MISMANKLPEDYVTLNELMLADVASNQPVGFVTTFYPTSLLHSNIY